LQETASEITKHAANGIIEQGVMGSFVILFFIIASTLLWVILRDKDYQKTLSTSLSEMVENQKSFNEQYRNSQEHHKEVVRLITQVTQEERANTKECYSRVADKQESIDAKLDNVLQYVSQVS